MKQNKVLRWSVKVLLLTVLVLAICTLTQSTTIIEIKDAEWSFIQELIADWKSCLTLTIFWEHAIVVVELVWLVVVLVLKFLGKLVCAIFGAHKRKSKSFKVKVGENELNSHNVVISNPRGFTRIQH